MLTESEARLKFLTDKYAVACAEALKHDNWASNVWASNIPEDQRGAYVVKFIYDSDPTPQKKYAQWMVDRYAKLTCEIYDIREMKDQLALHRELVLAHRLPNADINSLRTPGDLWTLLQPFMTGEEPVSADDESRKKFLSPELTHVIHYEPDFYIVAPQTYESERYWGSRTNWCTVASEVHFNSYMRRGPLYIVGLGERRWQLQFPGEFRQENDSWVDFEAFPAKAWSYFSQEQLWSVFKSNNARKDTQNSVAPFLKITDDIDPNIIREIVTDYPILDPDSALYALSLKLVPRATMDTLASMFTRYRKVKDIYGKVNEVKLAARAPIEREMLKRDLEGLSNGVMANILSEPGLGSEMLSGIEKRFNWDDMPNYEVAGCLNTIVYPEIFEKMLETASPRAVAGAYVASTRRDQPAIPHRQKQLYVALRKAPKPEAKPLKDSRRHDTVGRWYRFVGDEMGAFLYELGRYDMNPDHIPLMADVDPPIQMLHMSTGYMFKGTDGETQFAFAIEGNGFVNKVKKMWIGKAGARGRIVTKPLGKLFSYPNAPAFVRAVWDLIDKEMDGRYPANFDPEDDDDY